MNDLGLKVIVTEIEPDASTCAMIGKNMVINQSLDEGSEVKKGDKITLTTLKSLSFPDFSNKSQDEVNSWCNNACVTLNVEYQEVNDNSLIDKVITQSRPNGSTVKNNDSVTITIGKKSAISDDNFAHDGDKPSEEQKNENKTDKTN